MQLLVIRHGKAEEGGDDARRELTAEGREEMKKAAKGLANLAGTIDVVAGSPLVRAVQTAQIVAEICGNGKVQSCEALLPGRHHQEQLHWLQKIKSDATVALVGHDPDLSRLVSWLLTGKKRPILQMKKGAVVMLEFSGKTAEGEGLLKWYLTSKQLGKLK